MSMEENNQILEENKIVILASRIPSAFSILCSAYLIYSVLSDSRKRSAATQRIVLGISCSDILWSFAYFLAAWPMPRGTENALGAFGNTQTCSMQGFFLQLGLIMTPLYNGFLALFCFLYVCKDWNRQRINYVEVAGHIIVVTIPLSISITFLIMKQYNAMRNFCWIEPYPRNCTQSFKSIDGTTDCERGDNAQLYRFFINVINLWINILLSIYCMTKIYYHIRKQEKRMETYCSEYSSEHATSTRRSRSDSRDVAIRGALFTGAFFLTYLPVTINELLEIGGIIYFPAHVLSVVVLPSQGIFNFLVYIIHPAVTRHFKEKENRKRQAETMALSMQSEQTKCEYDAHAYKPDEKPTNEIEGTPEQTKCVYDANTKTDEQPTNEIEGTPAETQCENDAANTKPDEQPTYETEGTPVKTQRENDANTKPDEQPTTENEGTHEHTKCEYDDGTKPDEQPTKETEETPYCLTSDSC